MEEEPEEERMAIVAIHPNQVGEERRERAPLEKVVSFRCQLPPP